MGGKLSSCAGAKGSLCSCTSKDEDERKRKSMLETYPSKKKRKGKKKLYEEVDGKKQSVSDLKAKAAEFGPKLCQHDVELVEDRIRGLERQHGELEGSIQRKQQGYAALDSDLDAIKEEADQYLAWLDQCQLEPEVDNRLGYDGEAMENRIGELRNMETELSEKQQTLDSASQKLQALMADLPPKEREKVEHLWATVQTKHNELFGAVTTKGRVLEEKVELLHAFRVKYDKVMKWLTDTNSAADQFDSQRLLASDVDKQLDKCKSLLAKSQNQAERVNEVKIQAQQLMDTEGDDDDKEIEELVEEMTKAHGSLIEKLKSQQSNLRDCISARKRFEADCLKIDRWAKDTETQCQMTDLPADCAIEVLEEQFKMFKSLSNSVMMFESLVKETKERGEGFLPTLHEPDRPVLEHKLEGLDKEYNRVSDGVLERIKGLESKIETHSQTQTQIEEVREWLLSIQNELKQANMPIGHTSQDAELVLKVYESIQDKLNSFQPNMAELESNTDSLKASSQESLAKDIGKLSELFATLKNQTHQHVEATSMAISARRTFEEQMASMENVVQEQEDALNELESSELPLVDRLAAYKTIAETLQEQQAKLTTAGDRARHIGKQGTEDDFSIVTGLVESLNEKMKDLDTKAKGKVVQCEAIQKERDELETSVMEVVSWLESQEETLATCKPVHFEAKKMEPLIEKHKATSTEAIGKLEAIKEKMTQQNVNFEQIRETPTKEYNEKVEHIRTLEGTILNAIAKKEQFLTGAQSDRKQFENSMKQVTEWLRGAEDFLDSGYDGIDLDTLEGTLSDFTDYFTEASLCQDEIEQVVELSERLLPTLDANDSATMKQTLSNVNKKFSNVTANAQKKQTMLEEKAEQWKLFQVTLSEMNGKMESLESEWSSIDKNSDASPENIKTHLELVKSFAEHMETTRPLIDNFNDLSRNLDRVSNPNSRTILNRLTTAFNHRWDNLTGQVEAKQINLEEIDGQWDDISALMSAAEDVIQASEMQMRTVTPDAATHEELSFELGKLKEINDNMEKIEPKISRLQACSLTLQKALPTAEAKITSQERFMQLMESYETLTSTARTEKDVVQEEVDERGKCLSDLDETLGWFEELINDISTMKPGPNDKDSTDAFNRLLMYDHEISVRNEQTKVLEQTQESRYSSLGKGDIPLEIKGKLEKVCAIEEKVRTALTEKKDELLHMEEDRAEYRDLLQKVSGWLQKADMQLLEEITDIPEATDSHQNLLAEFEDFKPSLDQLRTKGGDIIRHSSDPEEKQDVQKTLAGINRQWLSLQAQTADRTQDLSEATDLSNAVSDVASGVSRWLEEAEGVVGEELQWTDFDKVKEQLKAHKRVQREVDPNQDKVIALQAMVKQLEQLCSTPANMTKVGELKNKVNAVQAKVGVQLSALEEANQRMETFEKEVGELMSWMEQTRAKMAMRDTNRDLKDQLAVQEQLLEDVTNNKARAEEIARSPEAALLDMPLARSTTSSATTITLTQGGHLMSEMNLLEESAREQRDSLKLAVSEQEKYETEIRDLNAAISESQQKLLASPVLATSVGALKQQIAEHNTLADQIKEYQERVKEINEKSRELALNSAQLSPSVFRKHYLPESAYSDFFSAASHNRANSPLPSTSPMDSDTVYTFGTQSPRTYSSLPEQSKELIIPKQSSDLLSANVVPKSAMMYSKVLGKSESPTHSPRTTRDESILSQSKPTHSSLSITSSFDTPPSSARGYETPLSSARSDYTPLSSARSYETPPSSARTIEGTLIMPKRSDEHPHISKTLESRSLSAKTYESPTHQSPRGVSSFDSGMDSSTFLSSSHNLQSQPSPSLNVGHMAEKLAKLQMERSKPPPPGGHPTELLRMQDSSGQESLSLSSLKSDDDTLVRTPRSTLSQSAIMSPRTPLSSSQTSLPSQTPAKFRSPRLQTLSTGWMSASDSELAHSTPRSSSEKHIAGDHSFSYRQQQSSKESMEPSPRERSSSFGAEVAPIGRPLGKVKDGSTAKELEVSFNTLQEQVMTKEKELQAALQRQEEYQHTVQELTAKMERAYMKLDVSPASLAAPLESQIAEHKATVAEIEGIKKDIAKVKDIVNQPADMPDSDGQKAMDATLTMLNDRFNNLKTLADDKEQHLQEALRDREKHSIALKAYISRVGELEAWLDEAKVRQSTSGSVSEEPHALQGQLEDNRDLQEQVNARLQQMSDLALQCDALCDKQSPAAAEKLRNELASLQNQLGQFKLISVEKQTKLRAAIKDAEKRKKEMEEVDSNVQRLQKWMSDTKELIKPTSQQPTAIAPGFHKELATDLKKHKQLVRQLSKRGLRSAPSTSSAIQPASDRDIAESWDRLSKELSQKTRNLEDMLRNKKPGDLVQVSLHAPVRQAESSEQLGDVKRVLGDLGDCWDQLQRQLDDKQIRLDEALTYQQQYQSALQNVSGWLDLGQQQLFTVPATTDEHIRQNENLQKEIRSLGREMSSVVEQGDELTKSTGGANRDVINSCLASLNNRIKILEGTVETQAEDLRNANRQWKQYQDKVSELQQRLQETQKLVLAPSSTLSLDQLMSNNQNIEAQLKKCEAELRELKSKESSLTKSYPKGVFPSELTTLQSNYMELQRRAQEKKASLQKSVSVQDQYQKMLKDYASFVETAQDKLRNDSITARDLNHLKQQLSTHKDFFSDLEVHKAILDSLCSQCDEATKAKHRAAHSSLSSQTQVLVDQASLHGQRLERLTRQWIELDEKHVRLQKNLTSLEAEIPRPIASGDSLVTIQDKLGKYKTLQSDLTDERGTVFEVVDRGKQILHSVQCSTLETAVADLAEKWVALNTDLTHELKRTETLGDQLSIFEAEAAVFGSWLRTAKMKNNSFKTLAPSDVQNIGAIRSKVEKVLEFRKEVENQLPLKNKVIKVGNELMQNKNYDTRGLSDRLRSYEEEWAQLEKGINETEEFLHQNQMELMPSRQALNELIAWIQEIKTSLKEDANRQIIGVADIEVMVKKYKGYKVELTSKQMTLDFVNQSVLAPGPHEQGVPHEKLEFAEKLGDLNKQWKDVVNAVDDRLNSLQGIHGKWEEYERAHQRLQAWIHEQEDKIKRYKLIGQEMGVKQTIRDCKSMQQQLQHKQADLGSINALGDNLIQLSKESPGCQKSVRDSLSSLEQNWKRLEEQSRQLENLLTDILGQWARYHTDLASLNQVMTQTEYCLNQYTLVGGDSSTLTSQVTRLKGLKTDLENHTSHLDSFISLSHQLRHLCDTPVQLEIQKTVEDVHAKWKRLQADLSSRCCQFENCLANWQDYESQYNKIRNWLDTKEQLCSDLITMRDDPMKRQESLRRSKELQSQLDNVQGQVSNLYRLSDELTKNMNTSTIVILTSRQSAIEQRLLTLRQILSQHMATLSEDLSQLGQFNDAFEVVKKFLSHAESILVKDDPTRAAETADIQMRLDQLKRLLSQFMGNMIKLDHVNDLGYRLALNSTDANRLQNLNHKWQDLYENTNERVRILQGHLLVQQDFTSKCEAWMTFLAQTEQDLATEIQTNLPGLREQLRQCEQFESEMYSRQQILHAIISDGQKMMKAGEVEDREEFQQKLQLLAEQWHSVSRRAHQRKAMIESVIRQWKQFNAMTQQLLQWLRDKEKAMKLFEFDSTSLQSVRTLVEKIKTTEREFKLQEPSFKKIHDLGNYLLQRADSKSADDISTTLDQVQKSWFHVHSQLDDHRSRLEGVDRQWLECEEDIEDILNWLKEIRQILHADIPTNYDDLQADMNRCKDIASAFVNSEDRRQRLLSKEKQLGRVVQADDLNLLHQRIRLLNKQWEELQHQTLIREQRLSDAMFRWNNLGERMRSLLAWINNMEAKVTSTKDLHVEDLLVKMETEYKDEMLEKEMEKNDIFDHGNMLMKVSSEIRASDMEQKLLRLEDKWNHLKAVMDFRHRKLQETVLAVKQLDTSMKNLSQWLSKMEQELSTAIAYKGSHVREIQTKLRHTQEIQEDIEQHSAGVSAVLNLCEVLLHDSDACPTEVEFSALQHAMKNLEKRWKNICSLSPQRRYRVEETWKLWELFREDCRKFSDWLTQAEREVGKSETDISNISLAKAEIKKYEDLQRKVHDQLSMLEHINRQYRHLAKEGRTDTDGSLKVLVTDLNNRWDALQLRVTEIMKKLRHSSSILRDFESTHSSLITWLTEVDMSLTNLESVDDLDWDDKLLEIQRIEDEIQTKRHRISYLDQAAIYLMQKGDTQDALRVQQKLTEFRSFSKSILERVVTVKLRIERMVVAQSDSQRYGLRSSQSTEDRLREMRDAQAATSLERQTAELEAYLEASPPESPPARRRLDASPSRVARSVSHRTGSPVRRAGAHTPRSSSPSLLRSSSPVRRSFSPVRQAGSGTRASRSPSRMVVDYVDSQKPSTPSPRLDIGQRENSVKIEILMEQLIESLEEANVKLARLEKAMSLPRRNSEQYTRLFIDCETAVESVRRLDRLLKTETGVITIASADSQVKAVLDRWAHLQTRAIDQDVQLSQEVKDLTQLNNDLDSMLAWLEEAEALQSTHDSLPVDISELDIIVRQYKDFLIQLEAKKATILSINLLSRNHMGSKGSDNRRLKSKLNDMNSRWDMVLARATDIQQNLQFALIQCQEFHQSINDYEIWSEGVEAQVRQCEPLNLNANDESLLAKYSKLNGLHQELLHNQPKVMSLKDTVDQLLISSESPDMLTARDKVYIINNRVRSLLHLTSAYVSSLEKKLKTPSKRRNASSSFDLSEGRSSGLGSSQASRSPTPLRMEAGTSSLRSRQRSPFKLSRQFVSRIFSSLLPSRSQDRDNLITDLESERIVSESSKAGHQVRPSLLMRVLRTALPIQLLLLLLLLLAYLVPVCEDEYSCMLRNNLKSSFSPMLHYTDGPPPV